MIKQHGFTNILFYQCMYSKSSVQNQSDQSDFSYCNQGRSRILQRLCSNSDSEFKREKSLLRWSLFNLIIINTYVDFDTSPVKALPFTRCSEPQLHVIPQ